MTWITTLSSLLLVVVGIATPLGLSDEMRLAGRRDHLLAICQRFRAAGGRHAGQIRLQLLKTVQLTGPHSRARGRRRAIRV